MNKSGSHVGMVLSFVVFVTFLVFLYSALEPAMKTDRDQKLLLEYLETELNEMFSEDLTTQIISIDSEYPAGADCISIPVVAGTEEMNVVVKDEDNNAIASEKSSSNLEMAWSGETFFKIFYSNEEFILSSENLSSCASFIEDTDYLIGSVRTREYIFENKILEVLQFYEESYEELKEQIEVSEESDFGFSFTNSSGGIVGTKQENVSISVYAEEIPIQYIDDTANILSGFIDIQIWG